MSILSSYYHITTGRTQCIMKMLINLQITTVRATEPDLLVSERIALPYAQMNCEHIKALRCALRHFLPCIIYTCNSLRVSSIYYETVSKANLIYIIGDVPRVSQNLISHVSNFCKFKKKIKVVLLLRSNVKEI